MSIESIPSEMPPAVTATRSPESSHRNLRLRFSSSNQLDSLSANTNDKSVSKQMQRTRINDISTEQKEGTRTDIQRVEAVCYRSLGFW